MAIRAIISDFGGVLTVPLTNGFEEFHSQSGIGLDALGAAMHEGSADLDGAHPLFELECGRISEERFIAILKQRLGSELGSQPQLDRFKEIFFSALAPNDEVIALMVALRSRGYRMAMLTNNVIEWEPLWRSKLDVEAIFETVVDSGFVGIRKPDPAIYELTVERLEDVSAEECLFVDDMDANCEAAREAGMEAVHFVDNRQAIAEIEAALGERPEPLRADTLRR